MTVAALYIPQVKHWMREARRPIVHNCAAIAGLMQRPVVRRLAYSVAYTDAARLALVVRESLLSVVLYALELHRLRTVGALQLPVFRGKSVGPAA
jgi:hypothetical protein